MYNPNDAQNYFNKNKNDEWERLEKSVHGRVEYEVTIHHLKNHLKPESYILDAGGGPGRYSIALAELGHKLYLLDISEEQLDLAKIKIKASGVKDNITKIEKMDICDMQKIPDNTFDAVLCLGGALSYVREKHIQALKELIRVAIPKGLLFVSVMSLLGTFHTISSFDESDFLENIEVYVDWNSSTPFPELMDSVGSSQWHVPMTLYTSTYLKRTLEDLGCSIIDIASTDTITSSYLWGLENISSSPKALEMLFELEKQFSNKPGLVDMGQHILVIARVRG